MRSFDGPPNLDTDDVAMLRGWWEDTSGHDFDEMIPKADEYSSIDLEIIGHVMERAYGIPQGEGQEAACLWYMLGKLARAIGAHAEGSRPSDDTLHDLTVYSMMARRIREAGAWPWKESNGV